MRCFKKAHKLVVICYSSQGKLIYFPCGHPGTQSPFLNFLFCLFFAPTPWVSLPGIEPVPPVLGAWSLNHWTPREVPRSHFFMRFVACSPLLGTFSSHYPPFTSRSCLFHLISFADSLLSSISSHQSLSGDFICPMTVTITST